MVVNSIFSCYSRFRDLDKEMDTNNAYMTTRIPNERVIESFPELKANPFADRICHVFSSDKDGRMSFEDFVDMVSALGPNTPAKVKAEWAFQIFGKFYDTVVLFTFFCFNHLVHESIYLIFSYALSF